MRQISLCCWPDPPISQPSPACQEVLGKASAPLTLSRRHLQLSQGLQTASAAFYSCQIPKGGYSSDLEVLGFL